MNHELKLDWFSIGVCVATGLLTFGLGMYFASATFLLAGSFLWYSSNLLRVESGERAQ